MSKNPESPSEPLKYQQDFDGPPPKLDALRDMEPIRMGDINYFDRGRHIEMNIADKTKKVYGQIVSVNHSDLVSRLGVRWNGAFEERSGHPEQVIRIEVTS